MRPHLLYNPGGLVNLYKTNNVRQGSWAWGWGSCLEGDLLQTTRVVARTATNRSPKFLTISTKGRKRRNLNGDQDHHELPFRTPG